MGGSSSKESDGNEEHNPDSSSMSYWSIMRQGYDELVNAIIRPPRAEYDVERLGPTCFTFCGRTYRRTDLVLVNPRGLALQCSHWEPVDRPEEALPCVVFMHGNSSARLEGLNQLSVCLGYGFTLFAFDCAGSGKSEGKYVSLGWFEKDDLRIVVDHLRGSGTTSSIAVWGRSMGAVTGLLYQVQDAEMRNGQMSVNAMVLDSPFADFCQLAEELVAKGRERGVVVPSLVTRMALSMLAASVKSVAGFDINDLCAIKCVHKCTLPALFICAKRDDFIGTHHTQSLHDEYGGPKFIIVADGDHNTLRSSQSMLAVGSFLQRELNVPKSWMMVEAVPLFASMPWRPLGAGSNPGRTYFAADGAVPDQGVGFSRDKVDMVHQKIGAAMGEIGYAAAPASSSSASSRDVATASKQRAPQPTFEEQQWCLDQAHYYCNRGNTLEESGKIDAAIRAYRAAITYHAEFHDAHYNLGIALKNRGQVEEAIREYRRTIEIKPNHADAHNNLGVALEESGMVCDAIEAYKLAIKHNQNHSEAHCNLADALQSVGRIEEAIAEYHIAVAQNENGGDSDTINNLGVALEANGQIQDAIAAYTKAVEISPRHWDAQSNLADALQLQGDLDRAADVYSFILDHNPSNAQIASSLGNVLHAKEQHAEALAAYERAVKYNSSDTITWNNMGIVLQSMGRVDRAIAAYKAALAKDPSYSIAHYNLGVAYQSQKKLDEAIVAYRTAVKHRKCYADAFNNLGYALQEQGDLTGAIESYRAAIKIRPDFASAIANLKHALAELAKAAQAAQDRRAYQRPSRAGRSPAVEGRKKHKRQAPNSHEIDFVFSPGSPSRDSDDGPATSSRASTSSSSAVLLLEKRQCVDGKAAGHRGHQRHHHESSEQPTNERSAASAPCQRQQEQQQQQHTPQPNAADRPTQKAPAQKSPQRANATTSSMFTSIFGSGWSLF
ncbi:hypothetical protein CTAYLR_009207 [Chrysophaeum taylorii]|uniref:Serine aminopeptidase S33 domain-containing protein n=1 Tax=Chrysophaeum taylorii TaxID=2483200 RepID=A0AAD7U9V4_9STRA|nr:hypothetical protein CTAYLR_009207 [Chrysophaeum taylorii]